MTFESQALELEQAGNEQLDKLAEEFDRWRLQKKSQAERINLSNLGQLDYQSGEISSNVARDFR